MWKTFIAGVVIVVALTGLRSAAQTGAGDKEVPAVDFKRLQALLPVVDGWKMGRPGGTNRDSPWLISEASARYTNGKMAVKVLR